MGPQTLTPEPDSRRWLCPLVHHASPSTWRPCGIWGQPGNPGSPALKVQLPGAPAARNTRCILKRLREASGGREASRTLGGNDCGDPRRGGQGERSLSLGDRGGHCPLCAHSSDRGCTGCTDTCVEQGPGKPARWVLRPGAQSVTEHPAGTGRCVDSAPSCGAPGEQGPEGQNGPW